MLFQHFHRIYHRILCSLTRTAIRQHPDAPFKYQPEHCHPRFIRSGHIPVGNPSANMDQCRFLFCNDTEHPSTGKCISDHGTEAAPSNWNCNIDRQDCKYRRRKWLLYTGNPNDINSQVRYVVSNSTFSDPSGRPITLSSLRPSQRVRITHATTQTASIPPQTIAFHVQLL